MKIIDIWLGVCLSVTKLASMGISLRERLSRKKLTDLIKAMMYSLFIEAMNRIRGLLAYGISFGSKRKAIRFTGIARVFLTKEKQRFKIFGSK
jgi:hypothetical protein